MISGVGRSIFEAKVGKNRSEFSLNCETHSRANQAINLSLFAYIARDYRSAYLRPGIFG